MKSSRNSAKSRRDSSQQKKQAGDFRLELWKVPARSLRFIGWRDDYSAIYLLDESDKPLVLTIAPLGFSGPVRFDAQPLSIMETRLLPPPCRRSRAEADLLRDMRKMVHGRKGNFHQTVQIYKDEAARLEIFNPTIPEPWELFYQDCLFQNPLPSPRKWLAVQDELRASWAKDNGLTLQGMVDERADFSRRHGDDLALLAQARYRMDCLNIVRVWLSDLNLETPKGVGDLDQIGKLLAARPELVHLTPEEAETALGLKPDSGHRTVKGYCKLAGGLNFKKLTRADLPNLRAAMAMKKDHMKAGGQRGRDRQEHGDDGKFLSKL